MNLRLAPSILAGIAFAAAPLSAGEIVPPTLTDERLEIELVLAEPDLVTPIGIAIDERGTIFVIESHTHKARPNYPGPDSDRVKRITLKADGSLDEMTIFADGFRHAMNLAFSPDGVLHLVHRNGVVALRDTDGDGACDQRRELVHVETEGDYPHNGLSGVAFGPDGWLYLGTGENLGVPYTLHGSDGSKWIGTGADGANIFRCRFDGSQVQLFARGAWNLFELEFDRRGNLFAVDNDPDGRPPCRLLHVVEGGDYGYKYRLGRHGQHPFQAWEGELPGTLPMVAGTSEAPSALWRLDQAALPRGYQDALLVTSWGDHRLELYRPEPRGASFVAEREVLAQGGESFRPVGVATAPDGSIYITDWVDRSYPVHGKGRLWRLIAKPGVETVAPNRAKRPGHSVTRIPGRGVTGPLQKARGARKRFEKLVASDAAGQADELLKALADDDPFIRSAAIHALARPVFRQRVLKATEDKSAKVRLGALLALRRAAEDWEGERGAILRGPATAEEQTVLRRALRDADANVRYMALAWIGEAGLTDLAGEIDAAVDAGAPSARVFEAYLAAAELLADPQAIQGGPLNPKASAAARAAIVEKILKDPTKAPALRAMALVKLNARQREAMAPLVAKLLAADDARVRLEAVRTLALAKAPATLSNLKTLAFDAKQPEKLRAEAVLALARRGETSGLERLLDDPRGAVRLEAARALRDPFQREQAARPATLGGWQAALAEPGDAASGRRVFFGARANCAACHRVNGRGGEVGPDLSTIARSSSREKLVASILEPSREIGPLYVQHVVQTTDGKTISGIWINERPEDLTLNTEKSGLIKIPAKQIEAHTVSKLSLMPEDLEKTLTVRDFRDLLAFLLSRR